MVTRPAWHQWVGESNAGCMHDPVAPFCEGRYTSPMQGFIYFDITDHARLPSRFFGAMRSVLARL